MTIKEFKLWLDQFPEDYKIRVISGRKLPMCKAVDFEWILYPYQFKEDKENRTLLLGDP